MCDALAVDDEEIGLHLQFLDGGYANGCFAEREQAWDVGESHFFGGIGCFYDFEIVARPSWPCLHGVEARATFKHDDSGQDSLAVLAESTIDTRNRPGYPFKGSMLHFACQSFLQISGL